MMNEFDRYVPDRWQTDGLLHDLAPSSVDHAPKRQAPFRFAMVAWAAAATLAIGTADITVQPAYSTELVWQSHAPQEKEHGDSVPPDFWPRLMAARQRVREIQNEVVDNSSPLV